MPPKFTFPEPEKEIPKDIEQKKLTAKLAGCIGNMFLFWKLCKKKKHA